MGAQAWMDLVEAEYSGRARVTQMLRDVALANATIAVQRVWRGQFATSQVKQMKVCAVIRPVLSGWLMPYQGGGSEVGWVGLSGGCPLFWVGGLLSQRCSWAEAHCDTWGCCHFMSIGNVGGRPSSVTPPPPGYMGGWASQNPKEANLPPPPPPHPTTSITKQRPGRDLLEVRTVGLSSMLMNMFLLLTETKSLRTTPPPPPTSCLPTTVSGYISPRSSRSMHSRAEL